MVQIYQYCLLSQESSVQILIMFDTVASIILVHGNPVQQQTAGICLLEFISFCRDNSQRGILDLIKERFLSLFFSLSQPIYEIYACIQIFLEVFDLDFIKTKLKALLVKLMANLKSEKPTKTNNFNQYMVRAPSQPRNMHHRARRSRLPPDLRPLDRRGGANQFWGLAEAEIVCLHASD